MEFETSSIVLLTVSAAVSFGLGRAFVHLRDKKRKQQALERETKILRDRPDETEARNRSKRRRQLEELKRQQRSLKR